MNRHACFMAIALGLIASFAPAPATAANPLSRYRRVYVVEVEYEYVTHGSEFWKTEFETSDYDIAMIVFDLLDAAFEYGNPRAALGLDDYSLLIPLQVRWRIRYEFVRPVVKTPQSKIGASPLLRGK